MAEGELVQTPPEPAWKRLADFPLVTMLIAMAALIGCAGLAGGIAEVALRGSGVDGLEPIISVIAMLLVYKLLITRLGERPRDDLRGRGAVRQTAAGLLIGLALFSVIVGVAALLGIYRMTGPGDASFLFGAVVAEGLFPAVAEELLYRGILFRWIEEFAGSWAALFISSALFGVSHLGNPDASWIGAAGIALEGGLLLGAAYMLTKQLWVPMGIHAAWNLTQGELFGIPVSGYPAHGLIAARLQGPALLTGNGFGLEASPIAISIGTLVGLWLLWLAVRKGEVTRPRWARRDASVATPR